MRRIQLVLILLTIVCMDPHVSHALTWEFNTDGDTEGWRTKGDAYDGGGNSTDLTVEDGILKAPVEKLYNVMVRLVSPRLELDAALYDRLILRVRTSEGSSLGSFGMNWMPGDAPTAGSTVRLHGRQVMANTWPDYVLWTVEWQEFQFTAFVEMNGWDGNITRIGISFGFREDDRDKVPDEIWIDSITLTGIGAERMGDPAKVFYDGVTGKVFRVAEPYRSANRGLQVGASGDVDGDNDVDLILYSRVLTDANAKRYQGRLDVLLNGGDGTFGTPRVYSTDSEGFSEMHLADLDGDGDLDLVVIDYNETLLVFPNAGDGRFMDPVSWRIPFHSPEVIWTSLWVEDLDGDDDPDLAISVASPVSSFQPMFCVYFNVGDGTFSDPDMYPLKGTPGSLTGVDLDGDGDVDMVVRSITPGLFGPAGVGLPPPDAVYVLRNDGSGGFSDIRSYPVGSAPVGTVAADFDGDGDLDLGVANVYSDNISLLLNRGDAIFVVSDPYPVGHEPGALCAGDFDGDGHADLTVAHRGDVDVWLLRGVGDGTFSKEGVYPLTGSPFSMLTDDFNGDGYLDLAVGDASGSNMVMLLNRASEEPTVVEEGTRGRSVPESLILHPAYPNPFNAFTTIRYDLPFAGRAKLCIYDVMGQRIRRMVDDEKQAGSHQVIWDGRDDAGGETASGMYLYRLEAQREDAVIVEVKRMILLR